MENGYCLKDTELQFCKIRRVIEMDSGDGCTTILMDYEFLRGKEQPFRLCICRTFVQYLIT